MARDLLRSQPIHTGEWQAMNTRKSPAHATHELEDVTFSMHIPYSMLALQSRINPDLPWAEDHFQERVSGIPHNPPPSAASWPYAVRGHADHTDATGRFDHTYPERFWPKHAGDCHAGYAYTKDGGVQTVDMHGQGDVDDVCGGRPGIRYNYGDLSDVVSLLCRSPYTRQAYLPVWFPEDTGAVNGQRVPCTLGYHFMMRRGELSCRYFIRSCDMRRHFVNDVYLACRLTQWICDQMQASPSVSIDMPTIVRPGSLVMHITSLHCFVNDVMAVAQRFGAIR
jgi:hypothetical protein